MMREQPLNPAMRQMTVWTSWASRFSDLGRVPADRQDVASDRPIGVGVAEPEAEGLQPETVIRAFRGRS